MLMEVARLRALAAQARVGHLATVTAGGRPHVVPICFALAGDVIYSAVDHKPKSTPALQRLANIRANPFAELVVDHYDDDWSRLWWVRAAGRASVLEATVLEDGRERSAALHLLADKYSHYRTKIPAEAVIRLAVTSWKGWQSSPDG